MPPPRAGGGQRSELERRQARAKALLRAWTTAAGVVGFAAAAYLVLWAVTTLW